MRKGTCTNAVLHTAYRDSLEESASYSSEEVWEDCGSLQPSIRYWYLLDTRDTGDLLTKSCHLPDRQLD